MLRLPSIHGPAADKLDQVEFKPVFRLGPPFGVAFLWPQVLGNIGAAKGERDKVVHLVVAAAAVDAVGARYTARLTRPEVCLTERE